MCGIAGFITINNFTGHEIKTIINNMSSTLSHRGPDNTGYWICESGQVALGHKRLSILDLSTSGHQPMISSSNRFIIVFNGEIYNHLKLRQEIDVYKNSKNINFSWKSSSDTETLLVCFEMWGFEDTINKLVGMFSICLFDKELNTLKLARDRLGEKPLYFGYINNSFVFASELKALKKFPNFTNKINRNALKKYFKYMYIPCPYSIYDDIYKLEPGHIISLNIKDIKNVVDLRAGIKPYWSLKGIIKKNNINPLQKDDEQYLTELENHIQEAIKTQSIADVPLGAFLSGGIDSSLITSLMQKESSIPVQTFTVGFEESSFDESLFAKEVSSHLGTEHHELFVTSKEARDVIPKLPYIYDEPFSDSSQIPTFLVCLAASKKVKVALSGDAGDELFGGYNRYLWAPRLWKKAEWMPYLFRRFVGHSLGSIPAHRIDKLESILHGFRPRNKNVSNLSNKIEKLSKGLKDSRSIDDLYMSLISEWTDPDQIVLSDDKANKNNAFKFNDPFHDSFTMNNDSLNMMYLDSLTYLPDDILCKVDRAAMANSLETRVPFLDHRVVEYAWKMPYKMKIRDNRGKWALRQILYKYVPSEIIDRPKTGFAVPLGEWLRGPLREWAEDLIDEHKLKNQGYLNHKSVREIWALHLSGTVDFTAKIWSILMFQSWLEFNS
ncbi:asparagine synthase (glutamine-hydrolyzing) [Gammaproteobacteria bacterium]|nr:asparagine synthase (glutamine-hydrolyzing) [Gammaproteobacteria bacterium]